MSVVLESSVTDMACFSRRFKNHWLGLAEDSRTTVVLLPNQAMSVVLESSMTDSDMAWFGRRFKNH